MSARAGDPSRGFRVLGVVHVKPVTHGTLADVRERRWRPRLVLAVWRVLTWVLERAAGER